MFTSASLDLDPRELPFPSGDKSIVLPNTTPRFRQYALAAVLRALVEFEMRGRRASVADANGIALSAWVSIQRDTIDGRAVKDVLQSPDFSSPSAALEPIVRRLLYYRAECDRSRRLANQLDAPLGLSSMPGEE